MKKPLLLVALVFSTLIIFAVDYYSQGSFAPNLPTSWNSARDGSGSAPANFTGADSFIIQNGHSMTTTATWTVSNASSEVEIENGGLLKAVTGATAALSGYFQIDGGGVYVHAVTGTGTATIPGAAGRRFANSTNGGLGNGSFEIQAQSSNFTTTGITWGNVVVNNSVQPSALGYSAVFADVEGNFTVKNTNGYQFRFTSNQTTPHIIKGNLTVQNGTSYLAFKSAGGTVNVTVYGNVLLQGGTLALASASTGTANLYFRGNFDMSGGTLTEGTSATDCTIYADGSASQNFNRTGGTISQNINFSIPTGKVLNLDNSVIDGSGSFTLADGASIRLSHTEGLAATGSTGAIQVTGTRSFGTAANYEYSGPDARITGSGLPASVNNLTFNSMGAITLSNDLTVNGVFRVVNGSLELGNNNFSVSGSTDLNPIFVFNGTGTVGGVGLGNNSMITVEVTNPTSLPSQTNQLDIAVGAGNIMHLPNSTFAPNLVFTSGSIAVGNYVLGAGGSLTGDAKVIYDGTGRIECNGTNLEITITSTNPGTLPGETGSLIINSAGTVTIPNNVHLGSFSMLAGSMDLNNKSVLITDVGVDLSGESVLSDLVITKIDAPTIVRGDEPSISKVWSLTGTSSDAFNLTLLWNATADNGYDFSSGNGRAWKYVAGSWSDLGIRGVSTNDGVHSCNIMATLSAKDSNGDYTISGNEEALPVVMSSFSAMPTAQQFIYLTWTTQSETGLSGYKICRSLVNDVNTAILLNDFIPANNTSNVSNYSFTDNEAEPGNTWYYWLQFMELDGSFEFFGPVNVYLPENSPDTPPVETARTGLHSIYPNPFNPTTNISFSLEKDAMVTLQVYNLRGELVKTILNEFRTKGSHNLNWNCVDSKGITSPSGVYLFKMTSGADVSTKKALLMK